MRDLIVYNAENPILVAYCAHLRTIAVRNRAEVARKKDGIQSISAKIMEPHREILDKIVNTRVRIRLLRKGEPATEAFDDPAAGNQLDDNLSDADRFLLKKAYRKAAAIAHPDRGGSPEEFQSVRQAFLAGDLPTLNEYFLLRHGDLDQRIKYWQDQAVAADVDWARFRATNEYQIVSIHQRGEKERAIFLAGEVLKAALAIAQREERELVFNISA